MRFPRSSSSQYATLTREAGPRAAGAAVPSRRSVRSDVFVDMSFALRGAPCVDEAHRTLGVSGDDNEQQAPAGGLADHDESWLAERMLRVGPPLDSRSRIASWASSKPTPCLARLDRSLSGS